MDESPTPDRPRPRPAPAPAPASELATGTPRRWFLAGGAALVLGAGAGVGVEFATQGDALPPEAPGALVSAAAAERALIADLDATTGGTPDVRRVIVAARADHAAHLAALTTLLRRYRAPKHEPTTPRGTPRSRVALRAAEQQASSRAATEAMALAGAQAALLASIAACEATHAALLG